MSNNIWAKYHLEKKAKEFEKFKSAAPKEVISALEAIILKSKAISSEYTEKIDFVCELDANAAMNFLIRKYEELMDCFSEHYAVDMTLLEKDGPALRLENQIDGLLEYELRYLRDETQRKNEKNLIMNDFLSGKILSVDIRNKKFYDFAEQLKRIEELEDESHAVANKYQEVLSEIIAGLNFYTKDVLGKELPDNPYEMDKIVAELKESL